MIFCNSIYIPMGSITYYFFRYHNINRLQIFMHNYIYCHIQFSAKLLIMVRKTNKTARKRPLRIIKMSQESH